MPITIINQEPEKALQSAVQKNDPHYAPRNALHFLSSELPHRLLEEEVLPVVRPLLEETQAAVYFLSDGDIIIAWTGPQNPFFESVGNALKKKFCPSGSGMTAYYGFNENKESLLQLCKEKIARLGATRKPGQPAGAKSATAGDAAADLVEPTPEQLKVFNDIIYMRAYRDKPVVLVVEDQPFSRSLMLNVLGRSYTVHVAESAGDAMKLFLENAPDIAFLDIELPGSSGHDFAAMIHKFDPHVFTVMVTSSNRVEDINRAKKNGVKGFIVKPYSKQKIMESIQRFLQEKKGQKSSTAIKQK